MPDKLYKSYWFWLEPYVHVSVKGDDALIYNTLSGKKLEYMNQPEVTGILKKMLRKKNLAIIELETSMLKRPAVDHFIKDIIAYFMGDMIDVSLSKKKPIQFTPILNIQKDIRKAKVDPSQVGKDIVSYLSEITLYINNRSSGNLNIHSTLSAYLYKQFLFPYVDMEAPARELPLNTIKKLISDIKDTAVYTVNIIGGNIFEYSQLGELTAFLNESPRLKLYHTHYLDAADHSDPLSSMLSDDKKSRINIFVTFPLIEDKFTSVVRRVCSRENAKLTFVIKNENEIDECERIVARFNLNNTSFQPYYNGKNLKFFKDIVFINREEIFASNPSQKEILARMAVNRSYFGKLTIMSSGNIYADVNASRIGNIKKNSIHEVIYKELYQGKSWLKLRVNVLPCKKCLYSLLCPSLSNYEYVLGRNNLCHIYK